MTLQSGSSVVVDDNLRPTALFQVALEAPPVLNVLVLKEIIRSLGKRQHVCSYSNCD